MRVQHTVSTIGGLGLAGALAFTLSATLLAQTAHSHRTAKTGHASISSDQARAAALRKYPGMVEGKVALENEEGKWQYAVNVRSGRILREVMVDAHTGKIASVEVTSKAEEAREARAEAAKAAHTHTSKTAKTGGHHAP